MTASLEAKEPPVLDMDPPEKLAADDYAVGDLHNDRALMRRVDWRILPIMFLTYFLQFVDKVSLNVSSLPVAGWLGRGAGMC